MAEKPEILLDTGELLMEMRDGPPNTICCWWSGGTHLEVDPDGGSMLVLPYYPNARDKGGVQWKFFGGGGNRDTSGKNTPLETFFLEAQEELFDGSGRITRWTPICRALVPCEKDGHKGKHAKYFSYFDYEGKLRTEDYFEGPQVTGLRDSNTGNKWVSQERLGPPQMMTIRYVQSLIFPGHRVFLRSFAEHQKRIWEGLARGPGEERLEVDDDE